MKNKLDDSIINQLNAKREQHITSMNLQKQLSSARNKEIETGEHEEQSTTGFKGIWNDAKDLVRNIPRALGNAAIKAPHAIYQAGEQALSLPKENLEFLYKSLKQGYKPENLPRLTKNLFEGVNEGTQLPANISQYLGEKELIPKEISEKIRPEKFKTGITEEEENPILKSLPLMGGSALKLAEEAALTKSIAARPLRKANELAKHREINGLNIPIQELMEAQQYLPKTLATRKLLEKAAGEGDYKTLFTLQSDIGKASKSLTRSASGAERLHGKEAAAYRQNLLHQIREQLAANGHEDIAELMQKGQKLYRRHHKYAKPAIGGAIALALGAHPVKHGIDFLRNHL